MTKTYIITDAAGEWVAGIRVRQGKVVLKTELELTVAQAERPLRDGDIVEHLVTKTYTVTSEAGEWVAGVRVRQGKVMLKDELELTAAQAEHPLRVGEIVLKSAAAAQKPAPAKAPPKEAKEK
jgi:hypothetical protein